MELTEPTSPEPQIITVVRRDMLGRDCLRCLGGTYIQTIWSESARCDMCLDLVQRWMTKKDMAKHTSID